MGALDLKHGDLKRRGPEGGDVGERQQLFGGFTLGRLLGVHIGIDYSLLIIFGLITFNLGAGVFPSWHPDWTPALVWGTALGAALLFFVSVLLHELSHALVARVQGITVRRITLFLFGGMAHMETEPPSPRSEFLMAVVGPITSLLIGAGATLAGRSLADAGVASAQSPEEMFAAFHSVGPAATLLLWLGPINIMLGLFNIVPGFPLDGGRVLRSVLWGVTKDLEKATRWAALCGQLIAWALMAFGILQVLHGVLGSGLWLLLIGWFLNNAAKMSYQQLVVRHALQDVPVSDVMQKQLDRVVPELPVDDFVKDHLMASDQRAFPVEQDGRLMGLACLEDVRKVPQSDWSKRPVSDIMTPKERLVMLSPGASCADAFKRLAERDINQIPVMQGEHLVGIVRRSDLMKWISLRGLHHSSTLSQF